MESSSNTLGVGPKRNLFSEQEYCNFSCPDGAGFYFDQEIIDVKTFVVGARDQKSISGDSDNSSVNFWAVPIFERPKIRRDIDMGNARVRGTSSERPAKTFGIPYQVQITISNYPCSLSYREFRKKSL